MNSATTAKKNPRFTDKLIYRANDLMFKYSFIYIYLTAILNAY